MPSVRITDEQQSQLEGLRTELSREYSGRYASVTDQDVMTFLLDLTDSVEEPLALLAKNGPNQNGPVTEETASSPAKTQTEASSSDGSPGKAVDISLESMLKLLETHRDKWGDSDGEEPYEVELPDGEVQTARTKDDVKAILFKHYR